MATNAVKMSTLASMLIVCTCEMVAGMNVFSMRMPANENLRRPARQTTVSSL